MADSVSHARHDRFGIAEAVGGGNLPSTIRTCPSCGALLTDLLAIREAIRHGWIPARPRDLHLSTAHAARLHQTPWRRLVAAIGTSRDAVTRPLGLTFTGLGLAGLLLTVIPVGPFGAATAGARASVQPESYAIDIAAAPQTSPDDRTADPAGADPLTVVSVGLLAAGGAVFGVRRLAPRAGAMR